MAFDSPEAKRLNKDIFECIYYNALVTSCALAKVDGETKQFHCALIISPSCCHCICSVVHLRSSSIFCVMAALQPLPSRPPWPLSVLSVPYGGLTVAIGCDLFFFFCSTTQQPSLIVEVLLHQGPDCPLAWHWQDLVSLWIGIGNRVLSFLPGL